MAKLDPELAEQIPDEVIDGVIGLRSDPAFVDALQLAESVKFIALVLPIVSFVGFAVVVWLSGDRRRAFITVGVSAVVVGGAALLTEAVGRFAFISGFDDGESRQVAGAVWDVVMGDLATLALVIAGAGSILAVVTAVGPGRISLRRQLGARSS